MTFRETFEEAIAEKLWNMADGVTDYEWLEGYGISETVWGVDTEEFFSDGEFELVDDCVVTIDNGDFVSDWLADRIREVCESTELPTWYEFENYADGVEQALYSNEVRYLLEQANCKFDIEQYTRPWELAKDEYKHETMVSPEDWVNDCLVML